VKLYIVSVHQVDDILGVRNKAEWAEDGTLGNAAGINMFRSQDVR